MLTGLGEVNIHLTIVVSCPISRQPQCMLLIHILKILCFMNSIITLHMMLCQKLMKSLFNMYLKHTTVCIGTF